MGNLWILVCDPRVTPAPHLTEINSEGAKSIIPLVLQESI